MAVRIPSLSIRFKLFCAAALLLAALVATLGLGVLAARTGEGRLQKLDMISNEAMRALVVERNLEAMGRSLLRYILDHDPEAIQHFADLGGETQAEIKAAREGAPSDETRAAVAEIDGELESLLADGAALKDAAARSETVKEGLSELTSSFNQAVRDLNRAVTAEGDPRLEMETQRLATLSEKLKVADWRSQTRAERDGKAVIEQAAADVQAQLAKLAAAKPGSEIGDLAASAQTAISDYAAQAQAEIEAIADQGDLYRNRIAPHTENLERLTGKARADLNQQFVALRDDFLTQVAVAVRGLQGFAALALIGGAFLSWLLVASIIKPLRRLTDGMHRLAAGEFDFHLPGLGERTEIGEIAQAVEIFKSKLQEKARSDADAELRRKAAEADQSARYAAEREALASEQGAAMRELGLALDKLAAKNLACRLDAAMPEAYAKLRDDFNLALQQLETALTQVRRSAEGVEIGTREIAAAAGNLSLRTEQQASQLVETANSLATITDTVRKTAAGALKARDVVADTRADAEKSGEVVRKAVEAMSRIEASSQKINLILGVIDEIAFQTNLLALNAGVEAARAGEAGRGFAVVAAEVRGLAQRSAEAAREIKELISTSTAQVGEGVDLVAATGQALERILTQVAEINTVIAGIALSAEEQSRGLEGVNASVGEMDQITQQNASMAEQATASSLTLSQESEQLARLIGEFQLGEAKGDGLRAALVEAAPHAFRASPPPAAQRPAGPRLSLKGGKAALAAAPARQDWAEF